MENDSILYNSNIICIIAKTQDSRIGRSLLSKGWLLLLPRANLLSKNSDGADDSFCKSIVK